MSEVTSSTPEPATEQVGPRRKGPPWWGIVVFLGLLGGLVVVNQVVSTGGKPVAWIDNDLNAALKEAQTDEKNRKVFLYIYEPNDPTHVRNERMVFTQRWAREPLENVVCCRLVVRKTDLLAFKYKYDGKPLFLLLDSKGNVLSRTEGAVDENQFFTYIGASAKRK
jgi:hypothetical protein